MASSFSQNECNSPISSALFLASEINEIILWNPIFTFCVRFFRFIHLLTVFSVKNCSNFSLVTWSSFCNQSQLCDPVIGKNTVVNQIHIVKRSFTLNTPEKTSPFVKG